MPGKRMRFDDEESEVGKCSGAQPVLYEPGMVLIEGKQTFRINREGRRYVSTRWTEDERRRLVEAVDRMGGKVPGWYVTLSETEFQGRSPHSINSQYNQLLRDMNKMIPESILTKEATRRETRPRSSMQTTSLYKDLATKYRSKPPEYKAMIGKIFWAEAEDEPEWPCRAVSPHFPISSAKEIQDLQQEALNSPDLFLVIWFGDGTYSNVKVCDLTPITDMSLAKKLEETEKSKDFRKALLEVELFLRNSRCTEVVESVYRSSKAMPFFSLTVEEIETSLLNYLCLREDPEDTSIYDGEVVNSLLELGRKLTTDEDLGSLCNISIILARLIQVGHPEVNHVALHISRLFMHRQNRLDKCKTIYEAEI